MNRRIKASGKADSEQMARTLFSAAVQGDPDSYWALVEPHSKLIFSVAYGILKDPEMAQDVLHEVYIKAFHSLNNLCYPRRLPSWLHTMTRNICYDLLRKVSRADHKRGEVWSHRPRVVSIYEVLVKEEEMKLLEKSLQTLPEPFRLILAMKYMNRMKCKQIAQTLDISVEAVKSRLYEARKLLAKRMEEMKDARKSSLNGGEIK